MTNGAVFTNRVLLVGYPEALCVNINETFLKDFPSLNTHKFEKEELCYRRPLRTALVTGTSTGIGLEIALHFAREGYRVYAGARRPEMVEKHPNIVPVKFDVDEDEGVRACVAGIGPVDVLVNNAGIGIAGAIEMVPMEKIRAMFETNFFGAVRMMQAVLPGMRERCSGTVVNITSAMGHITLAGHGYYAATKLLWRR